jgi:hypothetical protein
MIKINTFTLIVTDKKQVKTDIVTTDGISTMELHRIGLSEEDVLVKMSRENYYAKYAGEWELSMPQDAQTFTAPEFTKVTAKAIVYINERDNPDVYMINYF